MDELDNGMREVLLQLALLSNGRTSSFEASGSTDPDYTPSLSPGDAPHLFYAARYDRAVDDVERAAVIAAARERLDQERGGSSSAARRPARVETKAERDARIVADGEGWEAKDVAIHFRCGVTDVRKAREAAGRDTEYGRRPQLLGDDERRVEAQRMGGEGMPARQIAFALGASYSTILRDLGRKT